MIAALLIVAGISLAMVGYSLLMIGLVELGIRSGVISMPPDKKP